MAVINRKEEFEPKNYIITREKTDERGNTVKESYLPVKYRVLWFRIEHPNGKIVQIPKVQTDSQGRLFCTAEAKVYTDEDKENDSFLANGFGTRYYDDSELGKNFIQTACTAAVGRALSFAGYGTEGCGRDEISDEVISDQPVIEFSYNPTPTVTPDAKNSDSSEDVFDKMHPVPASHIAANDKETEEPSGTADCDETDSDFERLSPEERVEKLPGKIPTSVDEADLTVISYGAFSGKTFGELKSQDKARFFLRWYIENTEAMHHPADAKAAELILNTLSV